MINILFWNTHLNNKINVSKYTDINSALLSMVEEHDIDIIVLAEYDCDIDLLGDILSSTHKDFKRGQEAEDSRVKLLINRSLKVDLLTDSKYYFIYKVTHEYNDFVFLFSGVHFVSQLYSSTDDINIQAVQLAELIRETEQNEDMNKCVITGDFNLNPFDSGMIQCQALHAIPYADIVSSKRNRKVEGKSYPLFYNPMWNFMGDFDDNGFTYFYDKGGAENLYRYLFDQVLISSDMIKYFNPDSLKIIAELSEGQPLLKNGKPDKNKYSDHLPIKFSLEEDL